MPSPRIAVPIGICALSLASLLADFEPLYDPWAWLIWGRELTGLDLDTAAGPSWKPLPVLVTALLTPTGGAAPELWLFIARAGALAAAALAWKLAARLAVPASAVARIDPRTLRFARAGAGLLAVTGLVLLSDPVTSWPRQIAGGLSEPLLVALVLGAVDRGLSGREGQALALGCASALLRPEAWPLLAAYMVWTWRRRPALRPWIAGVAVAVPALWLVPDLLGSGDALTGAGRARGEAGSAIHDGLEAVGRAFELSLAALWAGAAVSVVSAWRNREPQILVLACGAAAWIAIVAVLAASGYAGLPRFAAPAAAAVCVLGAVGIARLVIGLLAGGRAKRRQLALVAGLTLVAGVALQGAVRAGDIPGELDRAQAQAVQVEDLTQAARDAGIAQVTGCPPTSITDFLFVPALAWELEVSLAEIGVRVETPPSAGYAFTGPEATAAGAALARSGAPAARRGGWAVYEVSCPAASVTSGMRIARVGGASRYGGSSTSPSSR